MKKLLLLLAVAVAVSVGASARESVSHDPGVLPSPARTTLAKNFKAKVSFIKIDKTLGRVDDYEVVLTDGTEVTFDSKGNWKEIETAANKGVPGSLVPEVIGAWVKKGHKGERIVSFERDGSGYELTLSNGIEAKFDRNGVFKKYD